jgi:parvulin-like peptidyl-prolyl isomerase
MTPPDDVKHSRVRQQAEDIRGRIAAGSLSFADAARKYSQAPSGAMGGDIGWISRREPMPEAFARAAYQLHQGELSPPITSSLGIHLIQCLEIEPGTRTWQDVRDELTPVVQRDIFDRLVAAAEGKSRVQFTGVVPHFRPGTKELEVVSPSAVGSQESVEK